MAKTTNPGNDLFGDAPQSPKPPPAASSNADASPSSAETQGQHDTGRDDPESRALVTQIMRTEGLDAETAWAMYRERFANFLDAPASSRQIAATADAATSGVPEQGSATKPARGAGKALFEAMVPKYLREEHAALLEARKLGLVPDADADEDQQLMQRAMDELRELEALGQTGPHPIMDEVAQKGLSFPRQPKNQRMVPRDFACTSLIHVSSNNKPRRQFKQEVMGGIGNNCVVIYTGEELRQFDDTVLHHLLFLASGSLPGTWIDVSRTDFIAATKGPDYRYSQKDIQALADSILRMRTSYIIIYNKATGMLKDSGIISKIRGGPKNMQVQLDPNIVVMMKTYTALNLQILQQLNDVPRAIFKYLSTLQHTEMKPTKVISYFELCYGQAKSIVQQHMQGNPTATEQQANFALTKKVSNFRRQALPKGFQVLKDMGLIKHFAIDYPTDKVTVIKSEGWLAIELDESGTALSNADASRTLDNGATPTAAA